MPFSYIAGVVRKIGRGEEGDLNLILHRNFFAKARKFLRKTSETFRIRSGFQAAFEYFKSRLIYQELRLSIQELRIQLEPNLFRGKEVQRTSSTAMRLEPSKFTKRSKTKRENLKGSRSAYVFSANSLYFMLFISIFSIFLCSVSSKKE